MSDIFQEVDEELRQENYAKLWLRYGKHLVALSVLVVVAVAGYQIWSKYDQDRRTETSDRFAAALQQIAEDQKDNASGSLAEIADPSAAGHALLAAFTRAQLLSEAGQDAEAIALWDEIAAKTSAGDSFRAIATLLSVLQQLDSGDPATLEARLAPLTVDGHGFRASALELSALLALKRGDSEAAKGKLEEVSQDVFAPAGVRQRAGQLLSTLNTNPQ